jgi:kinesin family protein 11
LHTSYASLGRDFKSTFDDLICELQEQREESRKLREKMALANKELLIKNSQTWESFSKLLTEERIAAECERQNLVNQMVVLLNNTASTQEIRLGNMFTSIQAELSVHHEEHTRADTEFGKDGSRWAEKSEALTEKMIKSRDNIRTKIKSDFATANERTTSLRNVTTSVHDSTTRVVAEQMQHMDTQLQALDDIVVRVKQQNNEHHEAHVKSLANLASTVQTSYSSIGDHFTASFSRIKDLDSEMAQHTTDVRQTLPILSEDSAIRQPLRDLREDMESQFLQDYTITGQTPQRISYNYPHALPRTEAHDRLLAKIRGQQQPSPIRQSSPSKLQRSPNKGLVFTDLPTPEESAEELAGDPVKSSSRPTSANSATSNTASSGLRELDINTVSNPLSSDGNVRTEKEGSGMPPLKKLNTTGSGVDSCKVPLKRKKNTRMTVAAGMREERENVTVGIGGLSASVGPASGHPLTSGRVLRSGKGS